MTTIVTTSSPGYAAIVADQGITGTLMHPEMGKVVRQDTWLIGVSGEDRVCDVIQYAVKYPKVPATLSGKKLEEWYAWVVTRVIPQIQKVTQEDLHKDYWNTIGESEILLVTHGKCFLVGGTLGVTKAEPYWAIGSGGQLAMGVLSQKIQNPDWKTKHGSYAAESVEVAKIHDPFTRGPVSGYKSYSSGKIVAINE